MTALAHLALRLTADPAFLAHALAGYARRRGLSPSGLAAELGCTLAALVRLALCRTPRDAADVRAIAAWAGVDAEKLVAVAG